MKLYAPTIAATPPSGGGGAIRGIWDNTDDINALYSRLLVASSQHLFNGATFDRARGNVEIPIAGSATRTATFISSTMKNVNARGILLVVDITNRVTGPTPQFRVEILGRYTPTGPNITLLRSHPYDPTIGLHYFLVYPSSVTASGGVISSELKAWASLPLPRTFLVQVIHEADITSLTYSLWAVLMV